MTTEQRLIKEAETYFFYEVFNTPICTGTEYPGTIKYFSDSSMGKLLLKALQDVKEQIDSKATIFLEDLSNQLEVAVTLKTAILALRIILVDIETGAEKIKFYCSDKDNIKQMEVIYKDLVDDYENLYKETIEDIKRNLKSDTYLVKFPNLEEDETLVVKVGNEERPASEENIQEVIEILEKVKENKNLEIVTHHVMSFVVVKTKDLLNGKVK